MIHSNKQRAGDSVFTIVGGGGSRIKQCWAELRRALVTGCTVRRYEQLETSPETIEQELRPVVCEHRQTDRLKENYSIDGVTNQQDVFSTENSLCKRLRTKLPTSRDLTRIKKQLNENGDRIRRFVSDFLQKVNNTLSFKVRYRITSKKSIK